MVLSIWQSNKIHQNQSLKYVFLGFEEQNRER